MTEELRQRNIEVGLISERPPSCMSDNDGDSRAGWMKEVLQGSLLIPKIEFFIKADI